jgi:type II secretory pathway component PulF
MYFLSQTTASVAGSSAFAALIWWVVPAAGLIGGIGYVVWISKFKRKFESETSRSVGQFQRFQDSFRTEEAPNLPVVEDPTDVDRNQL